VRAPTTPLLALTARRRAAPLRRLAADVRSPLPPMRVALCIYTRSKFRPQSLKFDSTSPPRQTVLTPSQASSMAMNTVQQYALSSMRAAMNSQEALTRIFKGVSDYEQAEIKQKNST
jgi:hypothetical protein